MKSVKSALILLAVILISQTSLFAQKLINEATLIYNISVESTNDKPERAKSIGNAELTLYIKGSQSRSDMTSGLGTESNLYDSRSAKGFILKEYSGQKLMITMTKENWLQKNHYYHGLAFTIDGSEQIIAGLSVKKATAVLPDGKNFVVYFAPGLILGNKDYNNAFAQLPGIPVQYEMDSGNLKFKYVLSKINYDPVASAKFEIPKTGYRVMTYDENRQLKKGDKK